MNRTPIFYGWYLVLTCISGMVLIYGVRHSFSVFFTPIQSEFGWGRGNVAMMLSLNILIYGFMAPVAGWVWAVSWVPGLGVFCMISRATTPLPLSSAWRA